MASDGSSEKGISVAFVKLSITSTDQTSSQKKKKIENPPPLSSQVLPAIEKIRKCKNCADAIAIN